MLVSLLLSLECEDLLAEAEKSSHKSDESEDASCKVLEVDSTACFREFDGLTILLGGNFKVLSWHKSEAGQVVSAACDVTISDDLVAAFEGLPVLDVFVVEGASEGLFLVVR